MGVQIIEQFICSKYPDQKKCEDGLFISNDFIAVIDGVPSKGELTWPDGSEGGSVFPSPMTSGRYAREILAQALKTMEPGIDAASAMEYLNQALAKAGSGRREFLRDHPEERLLSLPEALYLATKGPGEFFGKVGSFEPGYDFDALVVDVDELDGRLSRTPFEKLEQFLYDGDDRDILARYSRGSLVEKPFTE